MDWYEQEVMSRILMILLMVITSGCATTKYYESTGELSFNIVYNEDSHIFSSQKMILELYFLDLNCKASHQGRVELSGKGKIHLTVPANRWLGYRVSFSKSVYLTSKSESNFDQNLFLFKTKQNQSYQLDASYEDGMLGHQLFRLDGENKIEIESAHEHCPI